jgi:hypothetical protein
LTIRLSAMLGGPSGLQDALGRFVNGGENETAILTKRGVTITAAKQGPTALKPIHVDALLKRRISRSR